jgi:hypothetical protein
MLRAGFLRRCQPHRMDQKVKRITVAGRLWLSRTLRRPEQRAVVRRISPASRLSLMAVLRRSPGAAPLTTAHDSAA